MGLMFVPNNLEICLLTCHATSTIFDSRSDYMSYIYLYKSIRVYMSYTSYRLFGWSNKKPTNSFFVINTLFQKPRYNIYIYVFEMLIFDFYNVTPTGIDQIGIISQCFAY